MQFVSGQDHCVELTDANPTAVLEVTEAIFAQDLGLDVVIDKGCTIDVARYSDAAKQKTLKPYLQQTIADGGSSESFLFERIRCAVAVVTITKTEAGTTVGFNASQQSEA